MAATNKANTRQRHTPTTIIKVGVSETGKLPPQALELEDSVIGALMIEKEAYATVADLLSPESFYNDQNRYIYEAIRALAARDLPIDMLSVAEKLRNQGTLEEAGGTIRLSELTRRVASTAHLRYHAQIVAQKATARDLIAMAAKIEEEAYDETQDIEEVLQRAEAGVFEIGQRAQKREVTQIDPVIAIAIERMDNAALNESNISGIPSGFDALDKVTSGWQKSDLIVIAARPAMGKTAFVLSMAKNIALNYHHPVAIFSLEMSNVQLVNRLIMNVCEIEGDKIKTGRLSQDEHQRLNSKINELYGAPIYIDDTASLSVLELRSKARKLVREHQIELIIVDYLQLMNAQGMYFGSREQEISIISRNLKELAKELDLPIIALSQLNRGVESRSGNEGKKPQLSDLRESGAIEQDADMVCFIHRPEYYHFYTDEKTGKDLRGLAEIIIAKHRSGATAEVFLRFRTELAKFQNEDTAFDRDISSGVYSSGNYNTIHSSMNAMSADGASITPNNSMNDYSSDMAPF